MKKLTLISGLLLAMMLCSDVYAQLSKQEQKEWKKKAKEYKKNPEELKDLEAANRSLNSEVSKLTNENKSLQSQLSDRDAKISELNQDLTKLRSDLAAARAEVNELRRSASAEPQRKGVTPGVAFKVQIGAFRNKDLSKYFEQHENFAGEKDADGAQKITLMEFKDYWEADTFKKYMREMGVKDAWIVSYKDGVRVPLKDVLEGVIAD